MTVAQQTAVATYTTALNKYNLEFLEQRRVAGESQERLEMLKAHSDKQLEAQVQKITTAIDTKDAEKLTATLHCGNKASIKFFEEYTGHKIGKTNKEIKVNLPLWLKS